MPKGERGHGGWIGFWELKGVRVEEEKEEERERWGSKKRGGVYTHAKIQTSKKSLTTKPAHP